MHYVIFSHKRKVKTFVSPCVTMQGFYAPTEQVLPEHICRAEASREAGKQQAYNSLIAKQTHTRMTPICQEKHARIAVNLILA